MRTTFCSLIVTFLGHMDACTRDLIREKLAACFRAEYRPELLGKHLSAERYIKNFKLYSFDTFLFKVKNELGLLLGMLQREMIY